MTSVGVASKMQNASANYRGAIYQIECSVAIDGQLTDWFEVRVGLRQGFLLSSTRFNIFLEFVMKELRGLDKSLAFTDSLSIDIQYTGDTTLISTLFNKLNIATKQLDKSCKLWKMNVKWRKVKHPVTKYENNHNVWFRSKTRAWVRVPGSVVISGSENVKIQVSLASAASSCQERARVRREPSS